MVSTRLSTKLFGAFLMGQVVCAAQSPAESTSIVPSPAPPISTQIVENFKIFGQTGKPALKHIEEAIPIAFSDKNVGKSLDIAHCQSLTIGGPDWPLTWFPRAGEAEVFPDGQAASLPVDPKDGKRHEKFANLDSMALSAKLVPEFDFKTLKDKAWWPWALLEGVQAVAADQFKLDFASSITALSGYETVTLEGEQLADANALLKDVYSNAIKSPIWIQHSENGNYSVALDTEVHNFEIAGVGSMTNVTYLHFPTGLEGSEIDMFKFLKGSTEVNNLAPFRIVHLKDFPYFLYGALRVVDWARENPEEKSKPQE